MPQTWQIQEAKNRLSEVVSQATHAGPQIITKHGNETAVVISWKDYKKLTARRESLMEFFRRSPLVGVPIDFDRMTDANRREPQL